MRIEPAGSLTGHIAVPGDKSISHRALLIGAVAEGETLVRSFGRSGDTEATLDAVRALGVEVDEEDIDLLRVHGRGLSGLRPPEGEIDCRNAGTLMRLLTGLLAGQKGRYVLTGDESLRSRPMERIATPLREMGARIETREGLPPVVVEGAPLRGITYTLPVASSQIKSALLLAGLQARERGTAVTEPVPTRDHTELMLAAAGARVRSTPGTARVLPADRLSLPEVEVPGDFSSGAPFVVAATVVPGSELTLHGVGLNPRRTGLLEVLTRMGARLAVFNRRRLGGEPVGDLEVRAAPLTAAAVAPQEVPAMIDELPLFALAAAFARGESVVRGAQELRVKETDRIESVTTALRRLGIRITDTDDGFRVRGVPTRPKGGGMESGSDHRIAMLGAVAGVASREGVALEGAEAAAISFPGFFELLDSVTNR